MILSFSFSGYKGSTIMACGGSEKDSSINAEAEERDSFVIVETDGQLIRIPIVYSKDSDDENPIPNCSFDQMQPKEEGKKSPEPGGNGYNSDGSVIVLGENEPENNESFGSNSEHLRMAEELQENLQQALSATYTQRENLEKLIKVAGKNQGHMSSQILRRNRARRTVNRREIQTTTKDHDYSFKSVATIIGSLVIFASLLSFTLAYALLSLLSSQTFNQGMERLKLEQTERLKLESDYTNFRENLISQVYEEARECRASRNNYEAKIEEDKHETAEELKKALEKAYKLEGTLEVKEIDNKGLRARNKDLTETISKLKILLEKKQNSKDEEEGTNIAWLAWLGSLLSAGK